MLVRDLEVPDPAGAPPGWDNEIMGPSAPLVPFRPEALDPDDVVATTVHGWTKNAGTYGMGGPGFVALDLGGRWIVVTVWGASSWLRLDGRLLADVPATDTTVMAGWTITGCIVERTWMAIDFAGDHALRLADDPSDRPPFEDTGKPRVLAPDDDLRTAVVLAATTEIWV